MLWLAGQPQRLEKCLLVAPRPPESLPAEGGLAARMGDGAVLASALQPGGQALDKPAGAPPCGWVPALRPRIVSQCPVAGAVTRC